jgi:hypothetical protein
MAHIKSIVLRYDDDKEKKILRVAIALRPSGDDNIIVQLPPDFHDCIMKIAQTAADHHEQLVRAQILADAAKTEEK